MRSKVEILRCKREARDQTFSCFSFQSFFGQAVGKTAGKANTSRLTTKMAREREIFKREFI